MVRAGRQLNGFLLPHPCDDVFPDDGAVQVTQQHMVALLVQRDGFSVGIFGKKALYEIISWLFRDDFIVLAIKHQGIGA